MHPTLVTVIQHVRRMRGGAQSHLMRASDGRLYVVKFRNNPQHVRVLANEFIVTRLAQHAQLPVPQVALVSVDPWIIEHTADLRIQLAGRSLPCAPGLQLGSEYALAPEAGQVLDWLPESMLGKVSNAAAFAGVLALDKWLCNADSRQAVFCRRSREHRYRVSFIDHGYCFNAGEWTFPDSPLRGAYPWNGVYEQVAGWESFEPWLSRIEQTAEAAIFEIGNEVPPEWYEEDADGLERLLAGVARRRSRIRDLISAFRHSSRQPFPNWRKDVM
ncbi:MAG: phosphatidylinositol kinase [Acidobacteria bacterium]|nr:phosphatidylinositol kinase [Acidobacteriota bacterium]